MVTVAPQLGSTSSPLDSRWRNEPVGALLGRSHRIGAGAPRAATRDGRRFRFGRFATACEIGTRLAAVLFATAAIAGPSPASADVFVALGVQSTRVEAKIALIDEKIESTESGLHLGVGASRAFGERSEIGVRLELDDVGSDLLIAVRALDYRRHLGDRFAVGAFVGAARLDLATPAYGYYLGAGVQMKELMPGWDLSLDLRFGDKVARDNLLPEDPQGGSPDNFYDLTSVSLYLRRRF